MSNMSNNNNINNPFITFQSTASKIISRCDNHEKSIIPQTPKRLTLQQIRNITRSMIKDKKSHMNNMGIINNIKGKMYCLKLGEVSKPKQFVHYFYTTQYRNKVKGQVKSLRML